MAVIQKIRDKYAKVAGGIIVLALVGFILMDATSGGRGGGLFGKSTTVGKINGDKIDVTEYDARIKQYEAQLKQQNPQMQLDEATQAQVRDQVFNQMVIEKLMNETNEKLGIEVSDAELKDLMTSANPDPMVRQAFTNPQTGEFNPQELPAQIANIEKSKDPNIKAGWENFKNELRKNKIQSKFDALISGAIYSPKFVLDDLNDNRANTASISYVNLPFTLISDDKVKVTDADLNKFISDHKNQFEIKEENRTIDYVSYNIIPSADDSARVYKSINDLKEGFVTATDNEAYVNRNSENPMPIAYQTTNTLQGMPNAAELLAAAPGTVVGPFVFGDNISLAKVIEKSNFPDSVKVRHILVITKQGQNAVRTEAQAQARMDSMLALEKSGVPFDSLVVKYSDDYNPSTPNGSKGEYEFSLAQKSGLTKEFGDFAFSGAQASSKVVKVESEGYSGLHYIQILKRGNDVSSSKIAFINKQLSADKNTYNNLYAQASQFANKTVSNPKSFDKEVLAAGVQKQTAQGLNQNSYFVQNLGSSNEIVQWAYDAKVGDVSPIFTVGDKFVVAKLTEVNAPGLMKPTGNTKTSLENYLKQRKKAQLLIDANKGKNLATIAQSNQLAVEHADSVNFTLNAIPGVGNEPKILGYTFNKAFKENTVSPGIAGYNGVYFITVNKRYKNPTITRNIEMEKQMSDYMIKNGAAQSVLQYMREAANVKDLRGQVYN